MTVAASEQLETSKAGLRFSRPLSRPCVPYGAGDSGLCPFTYIHLFKQMGALLKWWWRFQQWFIVFPVLWHHLWIWELKHREIVTGEQNYNALSHGIQCKTQRETLTLTHGTHSSCPVILLCKYMWPHLEKNQEHNKIPSVHFYETIMNVIFKNIFSTVNIRDCLGNSNFLGWVLRSII